MGQVYIPEPLEHQLPVVQSSRKRKVLRCGRRWGKTRNIFYCSIVGHGPDGHHQRKVRGVVVAEWDGPLFRGVAHGLDVAWVARDYGQADAIWSEEILPRFENVTGVTINKTDKTVTVPGGGTLWIASAESLDSIRGAGAKLIGVVFDEAAWLDLEYAMRAIVMPMLLDNGGWLMLASTTNAGHDGNSEHRTPSFFNLICAQIASGERDPEEWEEFHGTAYDNVKLEPSEVDSLIRSEYVDGSVTLAQEMYAKLLEGGSGLAFPEWLAEVHVASYEPPRSTEEWVWTGGGDWGASGAPGALYLCATGPQRSLVRFEFKFNGPSPQHVFLTEILSDRSACLICKSTERGGKCTQAGPKLVGYVWAKLLQDRKLPLPEWMSVDTPPVAMKGPTILERLAEGFRKALGKRATTAWINPAKGPGSRVTKKQLLHDALRYERAPDGKVHPWGLPNLQVHPSCTYLTSTLPRLCVDPKRPEDVDTKQDDHGYDGITSWIMARPPEVEQEAKKERPAGKTRSWLEVVKEERHEEEAPRRRGAPREGRRWTRNRG